MIDAPVTLMYGQPVADNMFLNWKPYCPSTLTIFTNQQDPASCIYVKNKQKKCEEWGIKCRVVDDSNLSYKELREQLLTICNLSLVQKDAASYVVLQKPLPEPLKPYEEELDHILRAHSQVDLDALDGDLGSDFNTPATPLGIMKMLEYYIGRSSLDGLNAVVIGRSKIVGEPMARLLTKANCTVTLCHSHTKDLSWYTKNADLIVCAVGRERFLTADMIGDKKPIIVDVGINRNADGKVCGDVDFAAVASKCSFISPVPKGVGVLTVAALISKMGTKGTLQ